MAKFAFLSRNDQADLGLGFRHGARGTHSSRTIMQDQAQPPSHSRKAPHRQSRPYAQAKAQTQMQ